MLSNEILISNLLQIKEWLQTIKARAANVEKADDFISSEAGKEKLDSICMLFIAVGELLKVIDHKTNGELLIKYPETDWYGAMGFRDVIAHQYFQIDHEEVYSVLGDDLESLINSVNLILDDIR
jgi:uncharacterized protein with HEPN domain